MHERDAQGRTVEIFRLFFIVNAVAVNPVEGCVFLCNNGLVDMGSTAGAVI